MQVIRKSLRAGKLILLLCSHVAAAQQNTTEYEASFRRGYLEHSRGNYYDAVVALRQAEAVDPNSAVLKLLAMSYHGAHQDRLFLLKMNEALRKDPADFAPYYYLGRYFESDVSDFSKAAEYFTKAIARNPLDFRSHYHLGYCFEMNGGPDRAEAEYHRAIELAERERSQFDMPYAGLARLRLAQNLPDEAMAFARRAVEVGPKEAVSHELLAKACAELGRTAEAAAEWKLSSELNPTGAASLYRLYRAYLALGETAKAEAALERYKRVAALYGPN